MSLLTRLFPLWAVLLSAIAYQWPAAFTPLLAHTPLLLGVIMFFMGLTLTVRDFTRVLAKPAPVLAGIVLHYLVMPLSAWLIVHLLGLPPQLAAGVILVGCVASGTASNVIVYLSRGDVALSVAISSLSTIMGVVATPLLTSWLVDASIHVDAISMLLSIVQIVLLPIALGLLTVRLAGPLIRRVEPALPLLSMLAIVALIAAIIAGSRAQIATVGALTVLAVVLHNALGLAGGYWGGRLLGFDEAVCRTLAIEVGMQNSGLAAALGKMYFGPLAALPGALFSIWHNLSGSLLAGYWRDRPARSEQENPMPQAETR